jgi:flagellar motor component MotA
MFKKRIYKEMNITTCLDSAKLAFALVDTVTGIVSAYMPIPHLVE